MCYLLFTLHMMMHTRCCRRRLKSVNTLFVVLAVCAESSTFKSKHALGFSHTVPNYFQCREAEVDLHIYSRKILQTITLHTLKSYPSGKLDCFLSRIDSL